LTDPDPGLQKKRISDLGLNRIADPHPDPDKKSQNFSFIRKKCSILDENGQFSLPFSQIRIRCLMADPDYRHIKICRPEDPDPDPKHCFAETR